MIFLEWNFRNHVAVDKVISPLFEYCFAASELRSEEEVGCVFRSSAVNINQRQVLTVKTPKEGLGQSDGHVILSAVEFHSLSCYRKMKKENVYLLNDRTKDSLRGGSVGKMEIIA